MNLTVDIFKSNEINPVFVKANATIVSSHLEKFAKSNSENTLLKELWKTTHNCNLDLDQATLTFEDYQSMMIFMLKNSAS
jgi:hypothetical protein